MTLKSSLMRAQDVLLCVVRKWWRPVLLVGVAAGTWVNLVVVPIVNWQSPSLVEAAAWITACAGLSWVREWGKTKGVDE